MTDAALDERPSAAAPDSYLRDGHSLWSWLASTDHKRIAILYAITITVFFFIGGSRDRDGSRWSCSARTAVSSATTPTTSCSRCTAS